MSNRWNMFACRNIGPAVLQNSRKFLAEHMNAVVSLKVSTTVGTPSTRTSLKEALNEKIPVYHDLLRNFRRQYGLSIVSHITVENMYQRLNGVSTMVRETSEIDSKYGIKYRGLTIPEALAVLPRHGKAPIPEAVFWLLLTGDVPTHDQTSSLIADWVERRQKRKSWWAGPDGGALGSVLRTLPNSMTPLGKLSVALIIFDAGKHMREAREHGVMPHSHWEYLYEDGMDLLATLPAIVALVARNHELRNSSEEGDWAHFLIACLSKAYPTLDHRNQVADFLRLYITLNADEDGGVPGIHVTEILGATKLDLNHVLAAGALAYEAEPKGGTMSQYMEFHSQLQKIFAQDPKEQESLRHFLATAIAKDKLTGYEEGDFEDPRYTALLNYAMENLPDDSAIKFSRAIAQGITKVIKSGEGRNIFPNQSTIAAPMFQLYGFQDMKFNQVLLCMSRALGSIASVIWTKAINAPVEHPRSKCTYSYFELFKKKKKRGKYTWKYHRK